MSAKKITHCRNPRCGKRLTPIQIKRKNHFCSHHCSIWDKRHRKWNTVPVEFETVKSRRNDA